MAIFNIKSTGQSLRDILRLMFQPKRRHMSSPTITNRFPRQQIRPDQRRQKLYLTDRHCIKKITHCHCIINPTIILVNSLVEGNISSGKLPNTLSSEE